MVKKIIFILFLSISLFGGVYNVFAADPVDGAQWKKDQCIGCTDSALNMIDKEIDTVKSNISSKVFEINVNDTFGIGFSKNDKYNVLSDSKQKINFVLGTIIQKLMIALGVLSVLIMTVGGGYIIMFHGQDELLSKGKSIFMSGVIALVVALSSYYLVSGLRFILYNQ